MKTYKATFANGKTISRRYGQGWSDDEAWGHFVWLIRKHPSCNGSDVKTEESRSGRPDFVYTRAFEPYK